MASVEISPLLAWNSHKFIYFPPFLCCISSPILKLLGHCDGSNKKDHTEYCWEPPWLVRAVAASASVWGAGSLQVLELTPASPVSTSTRWPPSLRSAVLPNPRVYCTGPPSMTPSELTRILLLLVWMDPSMLSLGSPQHFTQGPLERPEPQVLELSLPGSSLTSLRNSHPKPSPPEMSQLCWVRGLKLRAPECGSWGRSIRTENLLKTYLMTLPQTCRFITS